MAIPSWFLTIIYWLHMMATVIWVGGLTSLSVLFIPSIKKVLDYQKQAELIIEIQKKFRPLGWFSLIVLSGTGLIQMSAHPKYGGFLAIDNQWALAILFKHGIIVLLIASMAMINWGILPAMRKIALRQSIGKTINTVEKQRLEKRERLLVRVNLGLSIIVLALTAWARSVS
jgi:uncharacterized membrane protein